MRPFFAAVAGLRVEPEERVLLRAIGFLITPCLGAGRLRRSIQDRSCSPSRNSALQYSRNSSVLLRCRFLSRLASLSPPSNGDTSLATVSQSLISPSRV